MLYVSKTCTVEECAKLCLEQEGCDYFIVGNGKIDGVDKTGASPRSYHNDNNNNNNLTKNKK